MKNPGERSNFAGQKALKPRFWADQYPAITATQWSIDDVADAHQALDYFAHCEYVEMRMVRRL